MSDVPRCILLGEDSKVFARAHEIALRKAGYEVMFAGDGFAVLEAARTNQPDLIVLDLMLPKLQGQTVLRELKKDPLTSRIPVIIYSGLPQQNESRLRRAGAVSYLQKNRITSDDFLSAVSEVFAAERSKRDTAACHEYWAEFMTVAPRPVIV
ncbi:MAG TPA: response regulator [Terriglobales bacterium]